MENSPRWNNVDRLSAVYAIDATPGKPHRLRVTCACLQALKSGDLPAMPGLLRSCPVMVQTKDNERRGKR